MVIHRRLATAAALLLAVLLAGAVASPADAEQGPVSPAYPGLAADPAVVRDAGGYYAFTTGRDAPGLFAPAPEGPWTKIGPRLTSTGSWAKDQSIWAPDVHQVAGRHWVMFYSALVDGLAPNQRCIGVGVSHAGPAGPYTPRETPLSCPAGATRPDGSPINATDQPPTPNPGDGLIDASAFSTTDGRRFVLYKTQRPNPITSIRVVEVDRTWSRKQPGTASTELRRYTGQIENPVMVQRGDAFVLFASHGPWTKCDYSTVWWRSEAPDAGFADAEEHILMETSSTGVCGPGGADITRSADDRWLMFFHGWTCDAAHTIACTVEEAETRPAPEFKSRALYRGELTWDGSTPSVTLNSTSGPGATGAPHP